MQNKEIKNLLEKIKKLREMGLVDEIALRNYIVKQEFDARVNNEPDKPKSEIISELAGQIYRDEKTVSRIIYEKEPRKKPLWYNIDSDSSLD